MDVRPGFRVETLYVVPKDEQGSWVSLAIDPRGRLIASAQYGGLYRIALPPVADTKPIVVEPLAIDLGMAHGLLCVGDDLYCVVNGNDRHPSGLYRVRDQDGDGEFDAVALLKELDARGEHGPHAVVLGPDGKSLYIVAGNHTDLPEMHDSRVPRNWQEDLLLPRMWDPRGHAVNRLAPGGWIARTDLEAKHWTLFSIGYRNSYAMAFNAEGELFTYDSDMEWDVGAPWYRPTRVLHVTSGSEFGWRSGSGKWPDYYPDSLPSVVDVGPGSPTGVVFGEGAHLPEKYQKALFCCDWSYGTIHALHLRPDGASYSGELEDIVTGLPLPVTNIVVNRHDGAMYFITGGRNTQSALYRITYVGGETVAAAATTDETRRELHELRRQLESLHGPNQPDAIRTAWPYLGHSDRHIRYAARVAIEHQPTEQWQELALAERQPQAKLTALVALARSASPDAQPAIVHALNEMHWESLTDAQRLELLRAYALTFTRGGRPSQDVRRAVLGALSHHYPADSSRLNRELSQLLIYLEAPGVVARTLSLYEQARTQEEQIHYVFHLRTLSSDWDPSTRRRYFQCFHELAARRGGLSFEGFLANAREEAIALLTDDERRELADVLTAEPRARSAAPSPNRSVVKQWSLEELVAAVKADDGTRDLKRGSAMFGVAQCIACHRMDGEGGIQGPDLTTIGRRFTVEELLESIVEPSKVVSDQYRTTLFTLDDGRIVEGRVVNLGDDVLHVMTNMLDVGNLTGIKRGAIEDEQPSPNSMMPRGLLDTLTLEEILDLVAYLRADKTAPSRAEP